MNSGGGVQQVAEPSRKLSEGPGENLSSLLCTRPSSSSRGEDPPHWITGFYVDVIRMDGKLGESVVLDTSWTIMGGDGNAGGPRDETIRLSGTDRRAATTWDYVAAQSRNVAALTRDIAEAIKVLSKAKLNL